MVLFGLGWVRLGWVRSVGLVWFRFVWFGFVCDCHRGSGFVCVFGSSGFFLRTRNGWFDDGAYTLCSVVGGD